VRESAPAPAGSTSVRALVLTLFASTAAASPTVFAPDVISSPAHDSAPAFAPDGKTVYFTRSNSAVSTILVSELRGATWSTPTVAPFSGQWSDMEPAMAPDGSFLVFVSNRPARAGGAVLAGDFGGKHYPTGGGNLWRVDRKAAGWSAPVRLPDTINGSSSMFAPAVVRDGSIYFMNAAPDTGKFHLYRSQLAGGRYLAPVALPFGNPSWSDVDPAVAPDESYAVFASNRPGGIGGMDLYIVRRVASAWGTPVHMGADVNSPGSDAEARLSPDGRTLYFASDRVLPVRFPRARGTTTPAWDNGLYNIWSIDLGPWLAQ
jgi:Tol biopolymer transport system component